MTKIQSLYFFSWLAVLVGTSTFLFAESGANQDCTGYYQCPASAPVCEGSCVTCGSLGNSGACGDLGTGASLYCTWTGSACVAILPVSEVPAPSRAWLFLFLPFTLVGLGYWRYQRRQLFSN